MQCPDCEGLKYLEYEAGLIQISCPRCKGTGAVTDSVRAKEDDTGKVKPIAKRNRGRPSKGR